MFILRSAILLGILVCGMETVVAQNQETASPPKTLSFTDKDVLETNVKQPDKLSIEGIQLERKKLLDGKVSMFIPKDFTVMGEKMLSLKYPHERRPTLVYTNEKGSVNIAFNHTKNRMTQTELKAFGEFMEKSFRNLYPSATWYRHGIKKIQGREWFILEMRTPALDTNVRNIMLGTTLENKLLIVSFNAIVELESTWLKPAEAIVNSLKIIK